MINRMIIFKWINYLLIKMLKTRIIFNIYQMYLLSKEINISLMEKYGQKQTQKDLKLIQISKAR